MHDPTHTAMAASSDALRPLLGRPVRVTISDGRVLLGDLYCVDYQGNVLLSQAERFEGAWMVLGCGNVVDC